MPTTLCMDGWFSAQSSLVKTDPSFIPLQSGTLCNVPHFLYYVGCHRFGQVCGHRAIVKSTKMSGSVSQLDTIIRIPH